MVTKNLYQQLVEEFKNDIDFKIESIVLDITEEICEIMDEQKINRADLSRLLNTSKSAVTKMLNGSTNFTLKRLLKIAMALDKDLDINFKEPKEKINFKDTKGTEVALTIGADDLASWEEPSPPQRQTKENVLLADAA